jgi:hypothetical protein
MTENLALELEMLNLTKSMEHSHWARQNLYFVVTVFLIAKTSNWIIIADPQNSHSPQQVKTQIYI